jgi:hypothetical protein
MGVGRFGNALPDQGQAAAWSAAHAITEACKPTQANGFGLEEMPDFSRHSRESIAVLMVYRDRERNVQGQLACRWQGRSAGLFR